MQEKDEITLGSDPPIVTVLIFFSLCISGRCLTGVSPSPGVLGPPLELGVP